MQETMIFKTAVFLLQLLFLRLICALAHEVPVYTCHNDICYKYDFEMRDIDQADDLCSQENYSLLSFDTEEEFHFLRCVLRLLNVTSDVFTNWSSFTSDFTANTGFSLFNESWIKVENHSGNSTSQRHLVMSSNSDFLTLQVVTADTALASVFCRKNCSSISELYYNQVRNFSRCIIESWSSDTTSPMDFTSSTTAVDITTSITSGLKNASNLCIPYRDKDNIIIAGCASIWVQEISNQVDNTSNPVLDILKQLEDKTTSAISVSDMTSVADLLQRLKARYKKEVQASDQNSSLTFAAVRNFSVSVWNIADQLLSDVHFETWKLMGNITSFDILSHVTNIVSDTAFLFPTVKEFSMTSFEMNNIVLKMAIKPRNQNLEFGLKFSKSNDWISHVVFPKLESPHAEAKIIVIGVLYKTLHQLIPSLNANMSIATPVISITLNNSYNSVTFASGQDVYVLHTLLENISASDCTCAFWEDYPRLKTSPTKREWQNIGCKLFSQNSSHVTCRCSHLTNFAVLMDTNYSFQDLDYILKYLSIVCGSISIFCEVLTIAIFTVFRSLCNVRTCITRNLCACLCLGTVLLMTGFDHVEDKVLCVAVAISLHYLLLAAFVWMAIEGYHMYMLLVKIFYSKQLSIWKYAAFGYGIPCLIVSISAMCNFSGYGEGDVHCWLSIQNGFIWSFAGPAAIIILINAVFLTFALRAAASVPADKDKKTSAKIWKWALNCFTLTSLLGVSWGLEYWNMIAENKYLSYISVFLNGSQGIFIFVFHCLRNDNVQQVLFKHIHCKSYFCENIQKFGVTNLQADGPRGSSLTPSSNPGSSSTPSSNQGSNNNNCGNTTNDNASGSNIAIISNL